MTTRRHTLWGDAQQVVIPAASFAITSRQLIHVEAPSPATWNIATIVRRVSGIAQIPANTTLSVILTIGCGRIHQELLFTFVSTGLIPIVGRIENIPAKALTLTLAVSNPEFLGPASVFEFAAWAAPVVPWEGLEVTPKERTTADESNSLEEVGSYFESVRDFWR
jgi:hypothetical protein